MTCCHNCDRPLSIEQRPWNVLEMDDDEPDTTVRVVLCVGCYPRQIVELGEEKK